MTLARTPTAELAVADDNELLRRLVAGWLLGYPSPHTPPRLRPRPRGVHVLVRRARRRGARRLAGARRCLGPSSRRGEHRALATVARKLAAVTAVYRYLVLEEVVAANPGVHARRPRLDPDPDPDPDPDHSSTLGLDRGAACALLAAAAEHSPQLHALVALLLNGLRISEALGLDVDDVTGYDRGHRIARLHRKGGRAARAALPPAVAAAVDAYLAHRSLVEGTRPTTGPLLVTRSGARWRPANAARALAALAARTDVSGGGEVTPHVLRQAAITLALDAGATLRDVQDSPVTPTPAPPAATTTPAYAATATPATPSPAHLS